MKFVDKENAVSDKKWTAVVHDETSIVENELVLFERQCVLHRSSL